MANTTTSAVQSAASIQPKYLGIITCLCVTFELVANVTAGKLIDLFDQPVAASIFFFPVVYIFSDVLTEVYGYVRATTVLWIVMICALIASGIYAFVVWLPPSARFDDNAAYTRVLGQVPLIVGASWFAVFAGEIANNLSLAKVKVWTKGKMLWLRFVSSTVVGQLVNSIVFYCIAFGPFSSMERRLEAPVLMKSILFAWLIKTVIEVLFLPFTYFVVNWLKKAENIDVYDTKTNFNPFKVSMRL